MLYKLLSKALICYWNMIEASSICTVEHAWELPCGTSNYKHCVYVVFRAVARRYDVWFTCRFDMNVCWASWESAHAVLELCEPCPRQTISWLDVVGFSVAINCMLCFWCAYSLCLQCGCSNNAALSVVLRCAAGIVDWMLLRPKQINSRRDSGWTTSATTIKPHVLQ